MKCKTKMKFGGKVELEGGEAVNVNGQGGMVEGPDHEDGGVDLDLPQGTLVFSKRIKVGNKTMADREMARLRKEKKAQKAMDKQPTDPRNRFTLDRILQLNDLERQLDLEMQQNYGSSDKKAVEMKYGGKYPYGTGPMGVLSNLNRFNLRELPLQGEVPPVYNMFNSGFNQKMNVPSQLPQRNPDAFKTEVPLFGGLPTQENESVPTFNSRLTPLESVPQAISGSRLKNTFGFDPQAALQEEMKGLKERMSAEASDKNPLEDAAKLAGPALGPTGLAISTVAPLVTTVLNRLGDKKPVNPYEDFGRDALESNSASMRGAAASKAQSQRQIDLEGDKARNIARNSARGISTLRALDQGTAAQSMTAKTAANTQYYNNLDRLFATRSQLQNQRDQMVMQGRDLASERATQDRDNFFTNINQDLGTLGEGMMVGQKMGRTPSIWGAFDGFRKKQG